MGRPSARHASKPPSRSVACREAELMQVARGEARLIALLADDHDDGVEIGDARVAGGACRVGAPFEHVARDADRAGNAAVGAYLVVATDVHEHGARCLCQPRPARARDGRAGRGPQPATRPPCAACLRLPFDWSLPFRRPVVRAPSLGRPGLRSLGPTGRRRRSCGVVAPASACDDEPAGCSERRDGADGGVGGDEVGEDAGREGADGEAEVAPEAVDADDAGASRGWVTSETAAISVG